MCVAVGDVDTFVTYTVCDCHGGESHIDEQRYMRMTQIVNTDTLHARGIAASLHFMVQIALGDRKDSGIALHVIQAVKVVFDLIHKEIGHFDITNTFLGLGGRDNILALNSLIGFCNMDDTFLQIKIARGQREKRTSRNGSSKLSPSAMSAPTVR